MVPAGRGTDLVGIQWDWIPQSVLQQQLSIQASTIDSILAHRIIDTDLVFTSTDVFDMARTIIQFALSKTPAGAGSTAQVAGITYTQGPSGIVDTLTFDGTQNQFASDALAPARHHVRASNSRSGRTWTQTGTC